MRLYESAFVYRQLNRSILQAERFETRSRFVVTEAAKANAIVRFLTLTPLISDGKLDPDVIIQHSDLARFADQTLAAKGVVENVLGIEVRSDIQSKPVQQLGAVLGLVGLKLARVEVQKEAGRKIYRYRLGSESLVRIEAIIEARKALTPRQFGSDQYRWPISEDQDVDCSEEGGDN